MLRLLICLFVALALVPVSATSEMEADFAWFDQLGYPDTKPLSPVRFVRESWLHRHDLPWTYGFLVKEDEEAYEVLDWSFAVTRLRKDETIETGRRLKEGEPPPKRLGYRLERVESLVPYAETLLKESLPPEVEQEFLSSFSPATKRFIFSRLCAERGYPEIAAKLYAAALEMHVGGSNYSRFRNRLEHDFGKVEYQRTLSLFRAPDYTRQSLVQRLEEVTKIAGNTEYAGKATELVKRLQQVTTGDETREHRSVSEMETLSSDAQAREWTLRLRDQTGTFSSWESNLKEKETPAGHLFALKEAAVPALIEALRDPLPTRVVREPKFSGQPRQIVTVGEVALHILERIAGLSFGTDDPKLAIPKAEKWWASTLAGKPLEHLSEVTAKGMAESIPTGRKLVHDYPGDAFPPLLAAANNAENAYLRIDFVRLIGVLNDPRVTSFLWNEVKEGPFINTRIEAACLLIERGEPDAYKPLMKDWHELSWASGRFYWANQDRLIDLLVRTDSPDGFDALAKGLRERTPGTRLKVLEVIERVVNEAKFEALSPKTQASIEALLIVELEDTFNIVRKREKSPPATRFCDYAAYLLTTRWIDRYPFNPTSPFVDRENQRIACINIWRESRNLPALPLPAERPPVKDDDLDKVSKVIFAGGDLRVPQPLKELFTQMEGRKFESVLFREAKARFLSNYSKDSKPEARAGWCMEAIRDDDRRGITLVIVPAERHGLALRPNRSWRIDYAVILDKEGAADVGVELDLFGKRSQDLTSLDAMIAQINALPATAPFRFTFELAPKKWDLNHGEDHFGEETRFPPL